MSTYATRTLIEQILAMPTLEAVAMAVQAQVDLLDDDFFAALDEMIAAESARKSSYHQFLSTRFSGGVADHALDQINTARQRLEALGMLRNYARQVVRAQGDQMSDSAEECMVLQRVGQQNSLSVERRGVLRRFSTELDALAQLRPRTATAKAVRENQLRELMQRLKATYVSGSRFAAGR